MPLNRITLGQAISDYNNKMITLSEPPFQLNKVNLQNETCIIWLNNPIDNIISDPIKQRALSQEELLDL